MTVTVLGVNELLAKFARIAAVSEVAEHAAVDDIGENVAEDARARAPVDTGTLQGSITYDDGAVTSDVEYAPFVEYGTATNAAQPFMRPAADTVDGDSSMQIAAKVIEAVS